MKKSIFLAFFLLINVFVFAQDELVVQKSAKGLYLTHSVVPKENFFSIGRMYNVSPKDIASFNDIDMEKGLMIGQKLRIPLSGSNFTQKNNNGRAIYYIVGAGEGLYRVSVNNNNVLMADLRKWNKLSTDNISEGQKLVIGYLVSPEANNIVAKTEPVQQVVNEEKDKKALEVEPPFNDDKLNTRQTEPEPKKAELTEPKKSQENPTPVPVQNGNGGYFKSHFELQVRKHPVKKDETASAGVFKTTSGWNDEKYYALIDGAETGTIIRIINPTNNKAIYAKVLGPMSGIRQNQGYDVRISNAAASALDVSDTDKFIVKVNY